MLDDPLRAAIERAERALAICNAPIFPGRRREVVTPRQLRDLAKVLEKHARTARKHPQRDSALLERVGALAIRLRDAALRVAIERAARNGGGDGAEIVQAMRGARDPELVERAKRALETRGTQALDAALAALATERTEATRRGLVDAANDAEAAPHVSAKRIEGAWRALVESDTRAEGGAGPDSAWSTERLATFLDERRKHARAEQERAAYVRRAESLGRGDAQETLAMEARRLLARGLPKPAQRGAIETLLGRVEAAPHNVQRGLRSVRNELRAALIGLSAKDPATKDRLLREAIDAARRDHGRESAAYAYAVRELGVLLTERGRFDEAEHTLRAARDVVTSAPIGEELDASTAVRSIDVDLFRLAIARGDRHAAGALYAQLVPAEVTLRRLWASELDALRAELDAISVTPPVQSRPKGSRTRDGH